MSIPLSLWLVLGSLALAQDDDFGSIPGESPATPAEVSTDDDEPGPPEPEEQAFDWTTDHDIEMPNAKADQNIAPTLVLGGFGHVQFVTEDHNPAGTVSPYTYFQVGGLDLFMTASISDRFAFVNETVFEFGQGGENILDVERVMIIYTHAEWLRLTAGRGHTLLGYWNEHYHHGVWLQPTAERPLILAFEDDGGALPVHDVGIRATGTVDASGTQLSYAMGIANGRGPIADYIQIVEDTTASKAFSGKFAIKPSFADFVTVGVVGLLDEIPTDPVLTPTRTQNLREMIGGGHMLVNPGSLELLTEAFLISHVGVNNGNSWTSYGGYALAAYRVGSVKPYYRYDLRNLNVNDPFFGGDPAAQQHTGGVRFDVDAFAAIKIEYAGLIQEEGGSPHLNSTGRVQTSFAF